MALVKRIDGQVWHWLNVLVVQYGIGQACWWSSVALVRRVGGPVWQWSSVLVVKCGTGQACWWPSVALDKYGSGQVGNGQARFRCGSGGQRMI